jgi:leucyl aminopeptidase
MQVTVQQGNIQDQAVDTVIVNLFSGVTTPGGATGAVDKALNGAISELIANGDISGKAGEVGVLYPRGLIPAKRVLVVGLGKSDGFDLEGVRKAAATAVTRARDLNAKVVATIVHGAGIAGLPAGAAAQATVEGALLALYRFDASKEKEPQNELESLTVVEFAASKLAEMKSGVETAVAIAAGNALARDLVNMPPNVVHRLGTQRRPRKPGHHRPGGQRHHL